MSGKLTPVSYRVVIDCSFEDAEKAYTPLEQRTKEAAAQTLESRSPDSDNSFHIWKDENDLMSKQPIDMFECTPKFKDTFGKCGYKATPEELKEIASTISPNFATIKLAMKQLNPQLFWQTLPHLSPYDAHSVRIAVSAFSQLIDSLDRQETELMQLRHQWE